MENRAYAIAAVSFLVVFSTALGFLTWWFTSEKAESKFYRIITTRSVQGLAPHSDVKFKGLLVGHVRTIGFAPQDPTKVVIRFSVHQDAYITRGTYAQLGFAGISGKKYLQLNLDKGATAALQTSTDNPARIPLRPGLLAQAARFAKHDLGKVNRAIDNINKLVDANTRDQVAATLARLDTASQRLVAIEKAMMPVLDKLPGLVDSGRHTLDKSQQVLAATKELTSAARGPVKKLDAVEASALELSESSQRLVENMNRDTLPRVKALIKRLDSTTRQVRQLAQQLKANPQSVLVGPSPPTPGPGEPGFER